MPSVNFYLKKKEEATGKSLIYLQFKYDGRKLVYSFGQTINPKQWNSSKQRVKSNSITTADGDYSLNDTLDEYARICEKAYKEEQKNGVPEPDTLKRYLIAFRNRNKVADDTPTLYKLIDRFIAGEIKNRGKEKAPATLSKYATAKKHLMEFETKTRYPVNFETINLDFFYKYVTHLRNKGLGQNTISKQIDFVQTFMNEAFDLKYTKNVEYKNKKFSVTTEESDAVYLTDKEIIDLYNFDFSQDKKLEQVRDLFVFGCCVGLRFSDFSVIKPQHIITTDNEKFIRLTTQKTGEQVVIPCNPLVLRIFEKYAHNPNSLPKSISNQKFNKYIKEACKEAGMTEKGRLASEPEKELWETVSSHTARRSFCTNLYLDGFPPIEIMKISGHRTEKNFLTYLKVSKLDAAKRLSKHMQLRWSEKLLKAV
jgi:integrase